MFRVSIYPKDYIHHLSDGPSLVWGPIHVEHWDWSLKLLSSEMMTFNIGSVHELSGRPTDNQQATSFDLGHICRLNLHLDDERFRTGSGRLYICVCHLSFSQLEVSER